MIERRLQKDRRGPERRDREYARPAPRRQPVAVYVAQAEKLLLNVSGHRTVEVPIDVLRALTYAAWGKKP